MMGLRLMMGDGASEPFMLPLLRFSFLYLSFGDFHTSFQATQISVVSIRIVPWLRILENSNNEEN